MNLLNSLAWFLRLGPLPLLLVAAAILGGGFYAEIEAQKKDAERAAAIAAGPPDAVDIGAFDPETDIAPLREVQVRAQLDLAMDYQLTIERDGTDDLGYMVPLVAVDAVRASQEADQNALVADMVAEGGDWPEVVGIAIYSGRDFEFGQVDGMTLASQAKTFGRFGPILTLNGRHSSSLGMWDDIVRDSFADQDRAFPGNPIVVFPYLEGRAAALGPRTGDAPSLFDMSKIVAGVIGALGLIKMVVHVGGRREDEAPAPKPARMAPLAETPSPIAAAAPTAPGGSAEPLWKRRLAEKTGAASTADRATAGPALQPGGQAPEDAIAALYSGMENDPDFTRPEFEPGFEKRRGPGTEPVFEAPDAPAPAPRRRNPDFEVDYMPDPEPARRAEKFQSPEPDQDLIETRRSGPSLVHKLLLGLVGLAFAVILIAVLASLFEQSAANDQRAAQKSPEELLAAQIAERFAPDTPPDQRAWYEIDVAPVVQWFVAKGLLAASGDKAAIITLMSMGIGLFVALFMLRWFFFARAALTPRGSPNIRSMGLN